MSFSAGNRIEARCTRCKDVTSHIVIVVVDNLPVKVECCACKSVHKYYPIQKPSVKKDSNPIRVKTNQSREASIENASKQQNIARPTLSSSTSSSASSSANKTPIKTENVEKEWHRALLNNHSNPKSYSINVELQAGDLVDHSIFGPGIVRDIVGADKAEVLFKEGVKILKCQAI